MPLDNNDRFNARTFLQVGKRPIRPDGVDKVTGRARFGADMTMPGMLIGRVLRSPHAHARIRSIDTTAAQALPGVKAVITAADFRKVTDDAVVEAEGEEKLSDVAINVIARDKALYEGHAVAAVAAVDTATAKQALKLIKVDYEVLPHVTDVEEAMKPGAPILHADMRTEGVEPRPRTASNIASRMEVKLGDIEKGFADADIIIERHFATEGVHQGYIEPHACVANVGSDGTGELWLCTQGHYGVRALCAGLLGMDASHLRVTASEIGGGFGGKTTVFMEPLALALSRKASRPVKIVMSRDEVFRASGPTSSSVMRARIGVKRDGRIVAGEAELKFQGGAFAGSPVGAAAMCAFTPYDIPNVLVVGYDVVTNRPKAAAYRAPGAPMSAYAVESLMDEIAQAVGMDPLALRLKNAAREGTRAAYGPTFGPIGMVETVEAAREHPHYKAPLGPNQGRGVASGFWFNFGGESSVTLNINSDGTVALSIGSPDIGGTRASQCQMAAEELGIDYERVRAVISDTAMLAYNDTTGGSRVAFATGFATIEAARDAIARMCERAAKIWGIPQEAVIWEKGAAHATGSQAKDLAPLTLEELAAQASATGGPIAGHHASNVQGAGVSFGTHICDAEVDPETGHVTVLRYTVVQDAGKAVHPAYVEGQFQGGAVQGIGWALSEEYIYGEDGRLQNAGFLDYRIPVCSDMPMIDTVIVEVPNPGHPYGVRGVGETPIVPPLAAVANAVSHAIGVRMTRLPMSPPRVLRAIEAAAG